MKEILLDPNASLEVLWQAIRAAGVPYRQQRLTGPLPDNVVYLGREPDNSDDQPPAA